MRKQKSGYVFGKKTVWYDIAEHRKAVITMSNYRQYNDEDNIEVSIDLANDALYHLNQAKDRLNSAKNWGLADILGGGVFITMAKRNRLSEAENEMRLAKYAINRLEDRLVYLRKSDDLYIEMSDFATTMDYLFDNPLTDIVIQSRISDAKDRVEKAIVRVEKILDDLYAGAGEDDEQDD